MKKNTGKGDDNICASKENGLNFKELRELLGKTDEALKWFGKKWSFCDCCLKQSQCNVLLNFGKNHKPVQIYKASLMHSGSIKKIDAALK